MGKPRVIQHLTHVDLDKEEGFFVISQGSKEMTIFVYVNERGELRIQGPMNENKADYLLRKTGIFNMDLDDQNTEEILL